MKNPICSTHSGNSDENKDRTVCLLYILIPKKKRVLNLKHVEANITNNIHLVYCELLSQSELCHV